MHTLPMEVNWYMNVDLPYKVHNKCYIVIQLQEFDTYIHLNVSL